MKRRVLKSWSVSRSVLNKGWAPPLVDPSLRLVGVLDGTRVDSIEVIYELEVDFPDEEKKE